MTDELASVSLAAEVTATKAVLDALVKLPRDTALRVVAGVSTLLGGRTEPQQAPLKQHVRAPVSEDQPLRALSLESDGAQHGGHPDLATFFSSSGADDGPAQAMVVAYWKQVVEGKDGWSGAEINSELKHMGHKLPNVTATMNLLIKRKPACVMQMKKSGSAKQARKLYKLTTEGIKEVKARMSGSTD